MADPTKAPAVNAAYKSPLDGIEFTAASDVMKYGSTMREVGRAMQLELTSAADELEAILYISGGVYEKPAARKKARKVAGRIRRAADDARAIAVEGVQLQRQLRQEYSALLDPRPESEKGLNWTE